MPPARSIVPRRALVLLASALVVAACSGDDGAAGAGRLRVCTEDGKAASYDVDVTRAIADDAAIEVEVVEVPGQGILGRLDDGACDVVASGVVIGLAASEVADLSDPYFDADQAIVVRAGDEEALPDLASLTGQVIGVEEGSSGEAHVAANLPAGASMVGFPGPAALFTALRAGDVAAAVHDFSVAYLQAPAGGDLVRTANLPTGERHGFAVAKGNAAVLELLDDGLVAIEGDGRLDEIYDRHYPEPG